MTPESVPARKSDALWPPHPITLFGAAALSLRPARAGRAGGHALRRGDLVADIETSMGTLQCALFADRAPNTVANFVGLARGVREFWDPVAGEWTRRPFYDGSIFLRVIPGFVIRGGDPTRSGSGGAGYEFADENVRPHDAAGLLCMANRGPNTNAGQFFVTDAATPHIDTSYSIFGRCTPLSLVHEIALASRDERDRPERPVFIRHVTVRNEMTRAAEAP